MSSKTSITGILNVTPDSFSDGGKYLSTQYAVSQVQLMLSEGADIIDLGTQSTRPKASKLSVEEELDQLITILEVVKNMPEMEGKLLSMDTFYSLVAVEAISKGAHLVNDVSSSLLVYTIMDESELPLEFPDGTTPVTCRVSIYDSSTDSKVGVGSSMDKARAPPLPAGSLYMEEVQVKVMKNGYIATVTLFQS
ncbi:unnamed protein product [Fraxinus pennsylvanica]|uniref:Pterin-binding domain-containing protein n=1 Tax=Fraxinus pennsylvanica TaxID=56036 RepID=A0AAD2A395_9LAMI|nr:unnamed protein product [Fraxinus pennsylvanica]